jgi:hypothetical protein
MIAVAPTRTATGQAVAWVESGDETLRIFLDAVDGGYVGHMIVANGTVTPSVGSTKNAIHIVPGSSLLVHTDGLLEARRVQVVGSAFPFVSWMRTRCR